MRTHLVQTQSGAVHRGTAASRLLTVTDVCLCLVPIGLFLSIISLV